MNESSLELVARWRERGDERAAEELFHRYERRLLALARNRMSPKMARRFDADDPVQSAFRSFFVRIRDGRMPVEAGCDLWRLLAAITMHKVLKQVEHHRAGRRTLDQEESLGAGDGPTALTLEALAHEPTPQQEAILQEEKQQAFDRLQPLHRQMMELLLQGHEIPEIAAQTQRTERMVRLVFQRCAEDLKQRLTQAAEG